MQDWDKLKELANTIDRKGFKPEADISEALEQLQEITGAEITIEALTEEEFGITNWTDPLLREDIRMAVKEMGLYDEVSFNKYFNKPFPYYSHNFSGTLGNLFLNADFLKIRLSDDWMDDWYKVEKSILDFGERVKKITGTEPSIEILERDVTKATRISVTLNDITIILTSQSKLRYELFTFLSKWALKYAPERYFVASDFWDACLVSREQHQAILRYRPFMLRAIDPRAPGTLLEKVERAKQDLEELGFDLTDVADSIGWELADTEIPGELIAQILNLL